jgi:hypothetical protein
MHKKGLLNLLSNPFFILSSSTYVSGQLPHYVGRGCGLQILTELQFRLFRTTLRFGPVGRLLRRRTTYPAAIRH